MMGLVAYHGSFTKSDDYQAYKQKFNEHVKQFISAFDEWLLNISSFLQDHVINFKNSVIPKPMKSTKQAKEASVSKTQRSLPKSKSSPLSKNPFRVISWMSLNANQALQRKSSMCFSS